MTCRPNRFYFNSKQKFWSYQVTVTYACNFLLPVQKFDLRVHHYKWSEYLVANKKKT